MGAVGAEDAWCFEPVSKGVEDSWGVAGAEDVSCFEPDSEGAEDSGVASSFSAGVDNAGAATSYFESASRGAEHTWGAAGAEDSFFEPDSKGAEDNGWSNPGSLNTGAEASCFKDGMENAGAATLSCLRDADLGEPATTGSCGRPYMCVAPLECHPMHSPSSVSDRCALGSAFSRRSVGCRSGRVLSGRGSALCCPCCGLDPCGWERQHLWGVFVEGTWVWSLEFVCGTRRGSRCGARARSGRGNKATMYAYSDWGLATTRWCFVSWG